MKTFAILTIIIITLLGTLISISAHDFKICGNNDNNQIVIKKVDFSSEKVSPGSKLGIIIDGVSNIELNDEVTAKISLKLHGVHIYTTQVVPCQEFEGMDCPSTGNFKGTLNYDIPEYAPHAKFEMEIQLMNIQLGKIGCFETEIDIRSSLGEFTHYKALFDIYIKKYNWTLDSYVKRFAIFVENLITVTDHNLKPATTYRLELNQFAHLTQYEFWATHGGSRKIESSRSFNLNSIKKSVPDSVDWRSKLVPVKNQKSCGSCWSFGICTASEFAYYLKTGKIVSFSEQQLVSCDKDDMGCQGGMPTVAYKFEEHEGFCLEKDYPYVSGDGNVPECRTCNNIKDSIIKEIIDVPINDEDEMKKIVSEHTVSAAVAVNSNFQFYRSGVFNGICPGNQLNHEISIVGYSKDQETGLDYWILRNSWGPEWGESGYMRIQRNKKGFFDKSGECGITKMAQYPIM
jgi:hypothetical protein